MMRKQIIAMAMTMTFAAVGLVAGCSGGSGSQGAASSIDITTTEFKFTPDQISAKAGNVTFRVTNGGQAEHNFVVEDTSGKKIKAIEVILPGKTETLSLDLASGDYNLACTLPGHKEGGMLIPLKVE